MAKETKRSRRWSETIISKAADIARAKGVSIRLEPDGTIVIAPAADSTPLEEPNPHGLKDW